MRFNIRQGVLLGILLVATVVHAAEPRMSTLRAWSAPGYTIFAHDEATARTVATHLATVERVLGALLKRELRATPGSAQVILLRKSEWLSYRRSGEALPEEWVPTGGTTYLILRSDVSQKRLQMGAFHQGTHLFLRRHFDAEFPLWFEEGLALVMQGTRIDGRQAIVGEGHFGFVSQRNSDRLDRRPQYEHMPWPYQEEWTPLDRLLRMRADSPEYRSRWTAGSVNHESWALVHKGLVDEPTLGTQMFAYVDAINAGLPMDRAVQASFGMNVVDLERILTRYTSRADFPVSRVTFEPPAPPALEPGRELDGAETLAMFDAIEVGAGPL